MDKADKEKRERKLKEHINVWFTNTDVLTKDKLSELKCKIDQATDKPDIIAISKIQPKNYRRTLSIEEHHIDCYAIEHLNIMDSNKGRCMVLYLRETPTTNFEEAIIVQLNLINLILTSIYRSPDSRIENNNSLNTLINSISKLGLQSIMIGDFNFNKIEWTTVSTPNGHDSKEWKCIETLRDNFLLLLSTHSHDPC